MAKTIRLLTWLISGAFTLVFLSQPVSVQAQYTLACAVIVAMAGVWYFGRGRLARWAFLSLGSLIVARYIFWRATDTLPPLDQPLNLFLGLVLFAAELYCVLILVISLIINADPLDRKPLEREDDKDLPEVDVFIPSYNEDEFILARTIAAAKSLDYPAAKLNVWLLDDGGTEQKINDANPQKAAAAMARRISLQKLCIDLGARYLTRLKNEHAKAGNLNNGLKYATGEIVVVFDADHAPFKSFLRETIGYFAKDPKLFLVQTPHVFLNPDPIERNLRTFQTMPSENEMFYSLTQRGLDKWNGSFFCGSAALLRREALNLTGGFSGITITEDCETSFELHARGWNSVYVDKPLIAGLQPETFESFIGQRWRWCQGMLQIMLLKNPLFKKGLKPIQKLAYLSSMTFWFFPLPRLVFTFAPLLHVFFNVKIFVASIDEALAYTATYMVVNLMLQNYLYGRVRWPFMSELYEYVQGIYLVEAITAVIANPHKPVFNVTAKGESIDTDHLSSLSRPFFTIFAILLAGSATAFYRYFTEPGAELMLVVGLWTVFNLVIAGVALGVVAERRETDRYPRLPIARNGLLRCGAAEQEVSITSVSAGGCSIGFADEARIPAALEAGAAVSISVYPLNGRDTGTALSIDLVHATRGEDATTFGFSFSDMTPQSYMTFADLMYGDPDAITRFVQKRRTQKNLLAGIGGFARKAVFEPARALSYVPQILLAATRRAEAAHIEPASIVAEAVSAPVLMSAAVEPVISFVAPAVAGPAPVIAPLFTLSEMFEQTIADLAPAIQSTAPVEADFDRLAAELLAASSTVEAAADTGADWMHSLLTLAARELSRISVSEESVDVASSVAA